MTNTILYIDYGDVRIQIPDTLYYPITNLAWELGYTSLAEKLETCYTAECTPHIIDINTNEFHQLSELLTLLIW